MRLAALLLLWVCFVPFAVVRGADGYDGTAYPYNTLVTDEGVKMLQQALPNCKIRR